jgi:hypothetical protein
LKKPYPLVLPILIGAVAGVVLASVFYIAGGLSIFSRPAELPPTPAKANNAELTAIAYNVLESIRDGDFAALSRAAHPEFGVVFSPFATVTLSTNMRFCPEQIAVFGDDSNVYFWGVQNGSGEPIEMTLIEYFDKFVYSRNYIDAPIVGVDRIVRSGNALENITEVFPGVRFVDFHFPCVERDPADEPQWSSLRLGFEDHDGALWLTVIINSRWTV